MLAGGLAAIPYAGVAWQVLHHLEGLRRLGHHVAYVEDTERWPYDPVRETVCDDAASAVAYLAGLLERYGFERWAYRDVASGTVYGAGAQWLRDELAGADVLINLSAVTVLREQHLAVPVRVYLETDPVLAQIEVAQGRTQTIELLGAHTHHFTYGSNFGAADCGVPIDRFDYRPTRPPVILDWWDRHDRGAPPSGAPFTTIASWRQQEKDIELDGELLTWSKDEQFLALGDLPRRSPVPLELALALDDAGTLADLHARGWRTRPARDLSYDIDAYRDYMSDSAGEFSVAKAQNIRLRSGWFSDRTATYLAAGRPAVVQDTGFAAALPVGEGLLAFATADQALEQLEQVTRDYRHHADAALTLAREHLRAEDVLGALLDAL